MVMVYYYSYDLQFNKESPTPFDVVNCWATIDLYRFNLIEKTIAEVKNKPNTSLSNDDIIYISEPSRKLIQDYKVENYFKSENISAKRTDSLTTSNVVILELDKALVPILYTTESQDGGILYPIKLLKDKINPDSLIGAEVDFENDFVTLDRDEISTYYNHLDLSRIVDKKCVFIYSYSKTGTEVNFCYEPFQVIIRAINSNKRIISIREFINKLHSKSSIIDAETASSIKMMLESNDADTKNLGLNIIADCNREKSMLYIVPIWYNNKQSFSMSTEPNIMEFREYMENDLYLKDKSRKDIIKILSEASKLPYSEVDNIFNG